MATSTSKTYYIAHKHMNSRTAETRVNIYAGTFEYLKKDVFNYSLLAANSWNSRLSTDPKTVRSLVKCLEKAAVTCRRYYDSYEVSTKEAYDAQEARRMNANSMHVK